MSLAKLSKFMVLATVASSFRQRKRNRGVASPAAAGALAEASDAAVATAATVAKDGSVVSEGALSAERVASLSRAALSECGGQSGKMRTIVYGAPKPTEPSLTIGGKCMSGVRVENEEWGSIINKKDIVTWLMTHVSHPTIQTLRLGSGNRSALESCTWQRGGIVETSINLHNLAEYVARSTAYGGEVGVVADIGLRFSYEPNPAAGIRAKGWGLAATADAKGELSHLIQNPNTLECILTFEGSDTWQDWANNINLIRKDWCGGISAHGGFVESLLAMINSAEWQTNVRPKLGFCSSLKVAGHSLGGAMAMLWSACADAPGAAQKASAHYQRLNFTWSTPKKLAYL